MSGRRASVLGGGPRGLSIEFDIDKKQFDLLMKVTPKTMNQEFNRGFKTTMGRFMKIFSKQAFGKGRIDVKRTGAFKKKKGGIAIPVKARKFGFVGRVHGTKSLHNKAAIVNNKAKFAVAHELGATIRPKKGKFLKIPIKSLAEARRAGVDIPRGKKPSFILVKKVRIKPRLRFLRTFGRFRGEAVRRLNKALKRAADGAIRRAKRRQTSVKVRK